MVTARDLDYVNRIECKDNRDCLKCDLKEFITQERADRIRGEIDLDKGIDVLNGKIDALSSKLTWSMATFLIALILFILEGLSGKL